MDMYLYNSVILKQMQVLSLLNIILKIFSWGTYCIGFTGSLSIGVEIYIHSYLGYFLASCVGKCVKQSRTGDARSRGAEYANAGFVPCYHLQASSKLNACFEN